MGEVMADLSGILLAGVLVLAATVYLLYQHTKRLVFNKQLTANLPKDLCRGSLYMCERLLTIFQPVRLCGKVDEVWERADGVLVPVDTKVRQKFITNLSDRYQLTGYALLLKHHPETRKKKIANYGYVRIPSNAGDVYLKAQLLKEHHYMNIYGRYALLKEGKVQARGPASQLFCNGCGHTDPCERAYPRKQA